MKLQSSVPEYIDSHNSLREPKPTPLPAHGLQPLLFFLLLFLLRTLLLPAHKIACRRKQNGINNHPYNKDTKVEADSGMQVKQDLM